MGRLNFSFTLKTIHLLLFYDRGMQQLAIFPRIREITDALGNRIRVTVEPRATGAVVTLEQPRAAHPQQVTMDGHGAEVLWAYIMAARLALPSALPDEPIGGILPCCLHLLLEPAPVLAIAQKERDRPFRIPATFWDRLYAELGIVVAHAREIGRNTAVVLQ